MVGVNCYSMRFRKDRLLRPPAQFVHRYGITPNMVTTIGLCFGIASGIAIAYRELLPALVLLLVSVFCDVLDGAIARTFDRVTAFGLAFDSVADRCAELSVVIGALLSGIILPIGVVAIIGSVALLLMRTMSYRCGLDTNYVSFGRVERITFLAVGLIASSTAISTFCFVIVGVFGLVSSCQIGVFLWHQRVSSSTSR
ncbi:MAG: CDP-alcohol phosphatidyltransferase family protein [Halobacteriota archaeon]